MTAAMIAQLLIAFGPTAIRLVEELIAVWEAPSLTPDQVRQILSVARTSYDSYIAVAVQPKFK